MLRVSLPFEARCRSRLLLRLEDGEQAVLMGERGRALRGGDRVRLADGREVEIVAADEPLLDAVSEDPRTIARAAYHLGNRHVAVQVLPDRLRLLDDHVLGDMLAGLGLAVSALVAPFEPEGGAYGHGQGYAHGHAPPGATVAKIHSFSGTP